MYDLGSIAPLGLEIRDSTGALANASSVTVTVTLPDGSTNAPSVTNPSTGTYQANYTTTQAGHHTARWVATGTNAVTHTIAFDVWPTDPRFIISLAEARDALNLPASDTSNDDELRLFIAAATLVIEDVVGPIVGGASYTEQHRPSGSKVVLYKARPLTFTSVKEYTGGTATTLTQAATPDVATDNQFTVDPATSVLTRRYAGGAECDFGDEVWVTYTAGASTVPSNVLIAARELVQRSYGESQQGGLPAFDGSSEGDEPLVSTPSGWLIPERVMQWLAPHDREMGGFG